MAKPMPVMPKKRGRPATGKDPMVTARMPAQMIESVDLWASEHADGSRSEAIRRLVDLGLKAKK
jgi:Arc/MetJ-type ribon-helix-helix transcriptional regulator